MDAVALAIPAQTKRALAKVEFGEFALQLTFNHSIQQASALDLEALEAHAVGKDGDIGRQMDGTDHGRLGIERKAIAVEVEPEGGDALREQSGESLFNSRKLEVAEHFHPTSLSSGTPLCFADPPFHPFSEHLGASRRTGGLRSVSTG